MSCCRGEGSLYPREIASNTVTGTAGAYRNLRVKFGHPVSQSGLPSQDMNMTWHGRDGEAI